MLNLVMSLMGDMKVTNFASVLLKDLTSSFIGTVFLPLLTLIRDARV